MTLLWEIETEADPALLSLMQTAADCALWAEGVTRPAPYRCGYAPMRQSVKSIVPTAALTVPQTFYLFPP